MTKDRRNPKHSKKKSKKKSKRGALTQPKSYLILPKGKRLATNVVGKLERENYPYILARALQATTPNKDEEATKPPVRRGIEERIWRAYVKSGKEHQRWKEERAKRVVERETKRRHHVEKTRKDELLRKKYRHHPNDPYHVYLEGYRRKRHRISKKRFMEWVDVPLLMEVLGQNIELLNSPLWDKTLDLTNLTFARARVLKDHLQQFEVLVEAIKQGILNKPGCDEFPIEMVRRKKKTTHKVEKKLSFGVLKPPNDSDNASSAPTKTEGRWGWVARAAVGRDPSSEAKDTSTRSKFVVRDKYKPKKLLKKRAQMSISQDVERQKKRRMTYPPYEDNDNQNHGAKLPQLSSTLFDRVTNWLADASGYKHQSSAPRPTHPLDPVPNDINEESGDASDPDSKIIFNEPIDVIPLEDGFLLQTGAPPRPRSTLANIGARPSDADVVIDMPVEGAPEVLRKDSLNLNDVVTNSEVFRDGDTNLLKSALHKRSSRTRSFDTNIMYGKYLSIKVPYELGKKRKFIHNLIENRTKENAVSKWMQTKQKPVKKASLPQTKQRYDPMERLQPDEKDSDIWTITTTTTTSSCASWRRPPNVDSIVEGDDKKQADNAIVLRMILLIIVISEVIGFINNKMDDLYYGFLTTHLYKENIWPVVPGFVPTEDVNWMESLQEWFHFIISLISTSIIHKENECVSLLFAISLLIDGTMKVSFSSYDIIFLPHPVSWGALVLNILHLCWKTFVISLFVAYHYYSAPYIRKSREFRHRKSKLHNHEINAKRIKGLQRRKMAWDWMVQHARKTNLRHLKEKYPNVRDGNFPTKNLASEIKFNEAKEFRIYAQHHNLNIGYPYNKLRDMKRYVFGELEKSDYSMEDDVEEGINSIRRRIVPSFSALTADKYQAWLAQKKLEEEIYTKERHVSTQNQEEDKNNIQSEQFKKKSYYLTTPSHYTKKY